MKKLILVYILVILLGCGKKEVPALVEPKPAESLSNAEEVKQKSSVILSNGKIIDLILPGTTLDNLAKNSIRCTTIAYFAYESLRNGTFLPIEGVSRESSLEDQKKNYLIAKKFVENLNSGINIDEFGQIFYSELIEIVVNIKNSQGDSVAISAAKQIIIDGSRSCAQYHKSDEVKLILKNNNLETINISIDGTSSQEKNLTPIQGFNGAWAAANDLVNKNPNWFNHLKQNASPMDIASCAAVGVYFSALITTNPREGSDAQHLQHALNMAVMGKLYEELRREGIMPDGSMQVYSNLLKQEKSAAVSRLWPTCDDLLMSGIKWSQDSKSINPSFAEYFKRPYLRN
jgi:hypothetical protein